VNLITINEEVFLTDVGYGSNNFITPLSLRMEGESVDGIHQEAHRLVRTGLEDNEDQTQKVWVLQHRLNPESSWRNCYCFTELEFRPEDFEAMNLSTSQSPRRFFTHRPFCTKMLMDDFHSRLIGRLTLGEDIKRNMDGQDNIFQTFKTEKERLEALKEYFDIEIGSSDANAIVGTLAEIKPPMTAGRIS
jgi:arylamine N-acetyltransferase